MSINSTDLLNMLKNISGRMADNADTDIQFLAAHFGVSLPVLVSVLTELEKRDEIVLNIDATNEGPGGVTYKGTVRLMERPPDELRSGTGFE